MISTAKARLVAVLSAALPDSQVVHGPIGKTTLTNRVLEVGGESTPIQVTPTNLTGTTCSTTYTLTLTVSVSLATTEMASAEDLAAADFSAAVAAIQADETLGLTNLTATCDGFGEMTENADASGRSAAIRFPVVIFTA